MAILTLFIFLGINCTIPQNFMVKRRYFDYGTGININIEINEGIYLLKNGGVCFVDRP